MTRPYALSGLRTHAAVALWGALGAAVCGREVRRWRKWRAEA